MKFLKLLLHTTIACLFATASGAAMAVGCPGGIIQDRTVDNIELSGESCIVLTSTVWVSINADGSALSSWLKMTSPGVFGYRTAPL